MSLLVKHGLTVEVNVSDCYKQLNNISWAIGIWRTMSMFKFADRGFSTFVISFILFLSVLIGYPNVAQADKSNKVVNPISFDPASKAVNVATVYETTPETQKDTISSIVKSVFKSKTSSINKAPGFNNYFILKSEDGSRVLALTQWQDSASYQTFVAPPAQESTLTSEEPEKEKYSKSSKEYAAIAPARTVVFEIAKTQAGEGVIPAIKGKKAMVEFDEFTAKDPADQPKLITFAEELMPRATQMQPVPGSVVLLKGIDNADVALLANWDSSEGFEELAPAKTPAFAPPSDELTTLVDTDQHLYEVVKVISAKPPKS